MNDVELCCQLQAKLNSSYLVPQRKKWIDRNFYLWDFIESRVFSSLLEPIEMSMQNQLFRPKNTSFLHTITHVYCCN